MTAMTVLLEGLSTDYDVRYRVEATVGTVS